jgi:hypothetical protein
MKKTGAALCVAAVITACGPGPNMEVAGHYKLVSTYSGPLPFVAARDTLGCEHILESGSTDLDANGNYTSTYRMKHVCGPKLPTTNDPGIGRGTFKVKRDSMLFYSGSTVTGVGHVFGRDTLHIRGSQHTLIFVKQP